MADKKPSSRIWNFLLVFAVIYLAVEFGMRWYFPKPAPGEEAAIVLSMQDTTVTIGTTPIAVIKNNTDRSLPLSCVPNDLPFTLYAVKPHDEMGLLQGQYSGSDCDEFGPLAPHTSLSIPLNNWKNTNFLTTGEFQLVLQVSPTFKPDNDYTNEEREMMVTDFTIREPGFFTKTFRAFITKPLLNALIFIASVVPQHDLGLAIIILTVLIKLLLYIPTKHALEGQKKMQLLQPKFEAVRKQYKDNPTKMNEETMKLWKEHKINPFQSMVPLLVQFPVLIGLFFVIRDGVHLDLSRHLIYPFYQHLDWSFDTQWLGFDLNEPYIFVFPPLLVVLQFIQMKLSFMIADKKKAKQIAATTTPEADTPQEIQQRIMLYALPLLIGFFALQYPSALSLYWGISTVFAIGQQMLVNREHIRP